ncbi:hypothetical protein C0993_010573 [Termitomyces sp. T159_Od127]|nr:hypothetical protein C0993_010573 [Termitomyces sp. T159_Od127]
MTRTQQSPDGRKLALSSETGQIYVFDLEASALAATYTSHAMTVRALAWSPDSSLLLSASDDKRLVLHDVRSAPGGTVASFTGHASWVLSADISPDGRFGLSGCVPPSPSVSPSLSSYIPLLFSLSYLIHTTADSANPPLAHSSADKTIKVWDIAARAAVATVQDTGEVWGVSWRPRIAGSAGGGAFVSAGEDGVVRWWRGAGAGAA